MKTKFRMTTEEMILFNDDCNNAANGCPQYCNDWVIDDRVIFRKEITPKQLVKHWLACETLWRSGYNECLSLDAQYVFEQYKEYKIVRKAEKLKAKAAQSSEKHRALF